MANKLSIGELAMGLALHPDMAGFKAGDAAINATTAKIKALAREAAIAKMDAQKLGEAMGMLDPNARKLGELKSAFASTRGSLESFSNRVMFGLVAAGAAATYTLARWSEETFKLGHSLEDAKQKTGISATSLQEFGYAAAQGNSSLEGLTLGAVHLSKNLETMVESAKKTGDGGPMANAFKAMGISLDDPAIKARNVEQILYSIANAASRMPDGAVKTAAFMAILGKSGAELIPTLNGGVLALKGMGAELHKLGAVMDDDSVQSLANMDKEVNKLKTAFTGLKDRAVIALLPELQSLADKMLKWIEANQDLINQRIPEIMREVVVVAKEIGSVLAMVTEHWKLLAGVVGAMTVLGAVSSVATTVSSLVGTVRLLTSAWSVMGTTGAGAFAGILGPLGLAIGSILLFNSRMSSHDSRDTIAGKNTDDVSWNEASQLRVDREAAPDVDSIVRAPKLTDDQLAARKAKPMSAETRAAVQSIQTGSAGARLSAFLQPTMISGGAPTDTASGTSGAAGPLLAATQSVPDAAANSPIIAVNVPNQRANTATNSITYAPNYQVAIDGSGLTPDQLKLVISDELRDHDERMRRDTAAALGVGGF